MLPVRALSLIALSLTTIGTAAASPMPASGGLGGVLPSPTDEIVQIQRDNHDRMTVPVRIGASGPYEFLIDTGSERTVLSRQVANAIGLSVAEQGTVIGVAGSQRVDLVDVNEISLGKRTYYTLSAPLLEADHIGADGIVGLDSLQEQRVLFDFQANRILIGDAASLGGSRGFEIIVRAKQRSGQLIMTNAVIDGVHTDIVLDTGSDASIGNPALRKALARRHKTQDTVLYSVTGQTVGAEVVKASVINVEGLQLHNTFLAFADSPAFRRLGLANRPALLLGMAQMRLFRRVAIDFATRKVLFDLPTGVTAFNPSKLVF